MVVLSHVTERFHHFFLIICKTLQHQIFEETIYQCRNNLITNFPRSIRSIVPRFNPPRSIIEVVAYATNIYSTKYDVAVSPRIFDRYCGRRVSYITLYNLGCRQVMDIQQIAGLVAD